MEEPFKATDKPKKSRGRRLLDVVITVVIILIIALLLHALLSQLALKREVSQARTVADKVVTDVRNKKGADARSLGDKTFQAQNSATNLTAQFEAASKMTTGAPVVDKQTVTNSKDQQAVSVIYKFPGKQAFYLRVIVVKPNGTDKFQLVNLNGNTTEKPLLDNKF
jgi:FtsZ-interacting cell division protein ZipA